MPHKQKSNSIIRIPICTLNRMRVCLPKADKKIHREDKNRKRSGWGRSCVLPQEMKSSFECMRVCVPCACKGMYGVQTVKSLFYLFIYFLALYTLIIWPSMTIYRFLTIEWKSARELKIFCFVISSTFSDIYLIRWGGIETKKRRE